MDPGVDKIIGFFLWAAIGFISYEVPIYLSKYTGRKEWLDGVWYEGTHQGILHILLFLTCYMLAGFIIWFFPIFIIFITRGKIFIYPLTPFFPFFQRLYYRIDGKRQDIKDAKKVYNSGFTGRFNSFSLFYFYFTKLRSGGFINYREPFTAAEDKYDDAVIMLGLEPGFTAEDLSKRYRHLMLRVHPDHAGPNDLARRITDAREIVAAGKGWRKQ